MSSDWGCVSPGTPGSPVPEFAFAQRPQPPIGHRFPHNGGSKGLKCMSWPALVTPPPPWLSHPVHSFSVSWLVMYSRGQRKSTEMSRAYVPSVPTFSPTLQKCAFDGPSLVLVTGLPSRMSFLQGYPGHLHFQPPFVSPNPQPSNRQPSFTLASARRRPISVALVYRSRDFGPGFKKACA